MVGIDDINLALPKCVLSIENLANALELDVAKLQKGLGLYNMSIPDMDEDVVTFAANALIGLLSKNPDLDPQKIGRIYVGTESMIDGSKPIASYLLGIVNQYFAAKGLAEIQHCDTSDMVFACIGAVDAMQNSLLWLTQNPEQYAIVISTDIAKYELGSPGEYTQGAGAVAMLLASNPRMVEMDLRCGVSTACTHDFFKPHRYKVLPQNGIHEAHPHLRLGAEIETIFNECPVFDGPVSNDSYQQRMLEAYQHYASLHTSASVAHWHRVIFHLPYSFHGRRMFVPLFVERLKQMDQWETFCQEHGIEEDMNGFDRAVRKTDAYREYTNQRIAPGEKASMQVGNMYTGSIFLSLISTLADAYENGKDLTEATLGFIAYGSGAKSKVFQGKVAEGWQERMALIDLQEQLANRQELDYQTYYLLHKGVMTNPVAEQPSAVYLNSMGITEQNYGARAYALAE